MFPIMETTKNISMRFKGYVLYFSDSSIPCCSHLVCFTVIHKDDNNMN